MYDRGGKLVMPKTFKKQNPPLKILQYKLQKPVFCLDDESKSMGSNEDSISLNRYNESTNQILELENQYKENISEFETKIADLIR